MNYGLSARTISQIHSVLMRFPAVANATLYGSHAIGTALDELSLPYIVDLSLFDRLSNPDLIDHIQRVGCVFYEKAPRPHA